MPRLNERVPLLEDPNLPFGWKRSVTQKLAGRNAGTYDVAILDPKGKVFHSKDDLSKYLKNTRSKLDADKFDFTVWGKGGGKRSKNDTISTHLNGTNRTSGRARTTPAPPKKNKTLPVKEKHKTVEPELLVNHHPIDRVRNVRENKKIELPTRRSARGNSEPVVSTVVRKRGRVSSPSPFITKMKMRKDNKKETMKSSSKESVKATSAVKSRKGKEVASPARPTSNRSRNRDKVEVKSKPDLPITGRGRGRPPKLGKQKEVEKVKRDEKKKEKPITVIKRGRQKKDNEGEGKKESGIKPDLAALLGAKVEERESDGNDSDVTDEYFSIFDEDPNLPAKRTPKPRQWSADLVSGGKKKKTQQQQPTQPKQRKKSGPTQDNNSKIDMESKPIEGLNDDEIRLSDTDILNVSEQYAMHGFSAALPQNIMYSAPQSPHVVSSLATRIPTFSSMSGPPHSSLSSQSSSHSMHLPIIQPKRRRRQNSDRPIPPGALPLAAGLGDLGVGSGNDMQLEINEVSDVSVAGLDQYQMMQSQVQMISDRLALPHQQQQHHHSQPSHAQQTNLTHMMAIRAMQQHQNAAAMVRSRRKIYDPSQAYYDHNYNRPYEESPEAIQQQLQHAAHEEQERFREALQQQQVAGNSVSLVDEGNMLVVGNEEATGSSNEGVEFSDEQQSIILASSTGDNTNQAGQYVLVRGGLPHYNLQVVGLEGNSLATDQLVL